MNPVISVREYAKLTTEKITNPSLDCARISASAFDWICNLNSTFSRSGAILVQIDGRKSLRLDNYVGVIETPCGTRLEILPKHVDDGNILANSRELLQRMIAASINLPARVSGEASLQLFDAPLSEWVMERFLISLDQLIKRGIRSDYVRIEAQERFLKGRLNISQQIRQHPGRQHIFQIEHDILVPDRPENRLLKTALEVIAKHVQKPESWRLAQSLRTLFQEIPISSDVDADFKRWSKGRLIAHYQPIRPWCELILYQQMPVSIVGQWHGISMLFPMEKLFERYVAASLCKALDLGCKLITQAASQSLCLHNGSTMFQLRPDLLIERGSQHWVLDTKWKKINKNDRSSNYKMSQSDFYQMFAYGQKYLQGVGELALIYPKHTAFDEPLPIFKFDNDLRLWALPFDLDSGTLISDSAATFPLFNAPKAAPALNLVA